jgi:hypothetical protein
MNDTNPYQAPLSSNEVDSGPVVRYRILPATLCGFAALCHAFFAAMSVIGLYEMSQMTDEQLQRLPVYPVVLIALFACSVSGIVFAIAATVAWVKSKWRRALWLSLIVVTCFAPWALVG